MVDICRAVDPHVARMPRTFAPSTGYKCVLAVPSHGTEIRSGLFERIVLGSETYNVYHIVCAVHRPNLYITPSKRRSSEYHMLRVKCITRVSATHVSNARP